MIGQFRGMAGDQERYQPEENPGEENKPGALRDFWHRSVALWNYGTAFSVCACVGSHTVNPPGTYPKRTRGRCNFYWAHVFPVHPPLRTANHRSLLSDDIRLSANGHPLV